LNADHADERHDRRGSASRDFFLTAVCHRRAIRLAGSALHKADVAAHPRRSALSAKSAFKERFPHEE
jgi:hypothetical protein